MTNKYTETWEEIFADEAASFSMADLLAGNPHVAVKHSHYISSVQSKIRPADKVLEAGCGRGQWVIYLEQAGYDCTGVDFAFSAMNNTKKEYPAAKFVTGDINTLCFKDNCFDTILCWSVVDHLEKGPRLALREMRRILKRGGNLFITVPCWNTLNKLFAPWQKLTERLKQNSTLRKIFNRNPYQQIFFQHEYARKRFALYLSQAGFKIDALMPFSQDVGFARAVNRILAKGSRRFHRNKTGGWEGLTKSGAFICRTMKSVSPWMTPDEIFAIAVKK